MKKSALLICFAILAGSSLAGCSKPPLTQEVASRLASPAWMVEREIPAAPFALTAYERMHKRHAPATIYIEGDGNAWLSKTTRSNNPTPINPVALHLASKDRSSNVAYVARPCQYSGLIDKTAPCDPVYWTGKRFAPEVLDAYNAALDEIKNRYDIEGFNLVGYSGGGAIAAILAAQREDVLTLRTVAGTLDHRAHSAHHSVSYLDASLNAKDYTGRLVSMPQVHFIGGQDEIMPPSVLESYLQALGPGNCVQYQLIQEAEHDKGWVDKWPELLAITPTCKGPVRVFEPEEFAPLPIYTTRDLPEKP